MKKTKCFIIISLILIFSENIYSQGFGASIGFSNKEYILFDLYRVGPHGWGCKMNLNIKAYTGRAGIFPRMKAWNENDYLVWSHSTFYRNYSFGIGKWFNKSYVIGVIGVSSEMVFRNYESNNSLDDYFVQHNRGNHFNYGGEIGIKKDRVMVGFFGSKYDGIGIKIGLTLSKPKKPKTTE